MVQAPLEKLYAIAREAGRLLILPHNDPDPDAISSTVALHYLLAEKLRLESTIAYQGVIGRAENRALVRYLGHSLQPLSEAARAALHFLPSAPSFSPTSRLV